MEIIKKNILLFSVIIITLIASLVLGYFILIKRSQMNDYIAKTNKLKNEIKKLNGQRVAPTEGNLAMIKTDTEKYTEKVEAIKLLIGQPYYRALKGFGAELGLTPEQLRDKFRNFCGEHVTPTTSYDQIIIKFRRQFRKSKKWNLAWKVFKREVNKVSIEKVDDSTAYSILLFVLGLPRNLSILQADKFRENYRNKICDKLDKRKINYTAEAADFSIDFTHLPVKEDIPMMVLNLTIIGDLVAKRLATSGILSLEDFKIRRLDPEVIGDYQYFRYTLTVQGTLENIRNFVNNLAKAYKESRLYIVRGVEIHKIVDEAQNILDKDSGISKIERKKSRFGKGKGVAPDREFGPGREESNRVIDKAEVEAEKRREMLRKKEEERQAKLPYYKRTKYGKVIIGASRVCEAVIDVDYVRYKANDISLDN